MKRCFSAVLSAALLAGALGIPAYAEEAVYSEAGSAYAITEVLTDTGRAAAPRGAYLLDGTSSIARESTTKINISGCTNATKVCDKVVLTLYVERSTSYATGYSTYKKYHYTAEDVYALVKGVSNITVERGYYYRVAGVHSVTHNGKTETTDSVTNPLDYR